MAKKDKKYKQPPKETTIENFYELKSKEMDELVSALKGEIDENTPVPTANIAEITGEAEKGDKKKKKEFDPYKRDKLSAIPTWIKALFIKFWFFGAVCYLVLMGLGSLVIDDEGSGYTLIQSIEQFLLCGIVTGIFVDCFVNPIFRMIESDRKEYNYFMMFPFPFKQFWTFFTNMIYYLLVAICVGYVYLFIDTYVSAFSGAGPLFFGFLCLVVDMAFIGIKDLIVFLVKRAVRKSREKKAMKTEGGTGAADSGNAV